MLKRKFRSALFGLVAGSAVLAAGSSAQAAPVTLTDGYWGGLDKYHVSGGDRIGSSLFEVTSATVTKNPTSLQVVIDTNYYPSASGAAGTQYGSLFLAPSWNVTGPAPYGSDVFKFTTPANLPQWTLAFVLNSGGTGALYSTGTITSANYYPSSDVVQTYTTTTGTIVMSNAYGNPISAGGSPQVTGHSSYYFRQGQAVQFIPSDPNENEASGSWSVAANHAITFSIADYVWAGNTLALAWAMTCANDVIQGLAEFPSGGNVVPLPAALPLFAGGLGMIGLLARQRKRKAAAQAAV